MKLKIYLNLFLLLITFSVFAQQTEEQRIAGVRERLEALSVTLPALKDPVQLTVTGASVQEFLRAMARSNTLNINIDPSLNFKIYNSFNNETPINILVFLAKEFQLDINLIGSIISVVPIKKVVPPRPIKELNISYNTASNALNIELNNDTLSAVAKKIVAVSGKNIVVPSALFNKTVSGYFNNAPFEDAINKLAYANGIRFIKTSDNIYLFEPLKEGEEFYINQDNNPDVRRIFKPTTPQQGSGGGFQLASRTVNGRKLLFVDANNTPIIDLVKAGAREYNLNYFLYSEIKGNISAHAENMSFDEFLSAMFQGTAYTYRKDEDRYLIGDRTLESLRATRIIQLQNRSIDTVQQMIPADFRKGVDIREFREQNTLLLTGSAPEIKNLENYIKQLDKLVPLILIEVTLVDVRKGNAVKTGIRAGVADSVKTGGTILPGIDYTFGANSINAFLARLGNNNSINLGRVAPNFYIGLSALENNQNVEIRSVPKLSTLNGHTANLSIGSTRYYSNSTQNVIPSLNTQTVITQQFIPVEANLSIFIKPIVSGDDQVTLNIKVDISDFIGTPPTNQPPPTSTSKFESIIRAKNEDMIVLGGLERTEKSESGTGVPFLSRIPVIKWLFSSRERSNNKVVTIVFIKPTIIY